MKIDIYWQRFISVFCTEFNPLIPKKFVAEFFHKGAKYRAVLSVQEIPLDSQEQINRMEFEQA